MTEEELQALLERTTPQRERHELFVEECQEQDVRVRFSAPKGEGWSMTALLGVAEIALRAAAREDVEMTHFNATRIRMAQEADVLSLSRVIRRSSGTIYAEAWLFSHALIEPMLHATATLSTKS